MIWMILKVLLLLERCQTKKKYILMSPCIENYWKWKKKKSVVTESTSVLHCLGRWVRSVKIEALQRDLKKLHGRWILPFFVVMVSWLCNYVKTCQVVSFKKGKLGMSIITQWSHGTYVCVWSVDRLTYLPTYPSRATTKKIPQKLQLKYQ